MGGSLHIRNDTLEEGQRAESEGAVVHANANFILSRAHGSDRPAYFLLGSHKGTNEKAKTPRNLLV